MFRIIYIEKKFVTLPLIKMRNKSCDFIENFGEKFFFLDSLYFISTF